MQNRCTAPQPRQSATYIDTRSPKNTVTRNGLPVNPSEGIIPVDGIFINRYSSGERLSDNTSDRNTGDGINDQAHSTVSSNRADFNQGHGIETNGTDGGHNKARHNQTPPQCIGVICS